MGIHDSMTRYHLLGHTGLRISPLTLGTMTFGMGEVGSDEDEARAVFRRYLEAGGNVLDTANVYAGGASEQMLGRFVAEEGVRDRVVLATKFGNLVDERNPNHRNRGNGRVDPHASGNGRKTIRSALEASLQRLGTDYIDLYWLHFWDMVTPVEEVVSTLGALVRDGKIHTYGLSNVPVWYAVKVHVLARSQGLEPPAALQMQYSLLEREIEREYVPAALELGMDIFPWSPLANGFLTGKYSRSEQTATDGEPGRLESASYQQVLELMGGRAEWHWAVLDVVREIADEAGRTPAEVALNWVTRRPGVGSTIVGARTPEQLETNLTALSWELTEKQDERLDQVSALAPGYPSMMFDRELVRQFLMPGVRVDREPEWFRER